ncbi:MAG TPA: putative toxin-antitoxin system toxin component, PIN family [Conexibacter sp.]
MKRLVIDTSTLVSGAVSPPTSPPAVLLDAAQAAVYDLIACPRILTEIERALTKPYFEARFTPAERTDLIETVRLVAIMLPDPPVVRRVVRDPNDDFLVELASTARAAAIVSGDADLLDHHDLEPPAISARTACEQLGLL